MLLEDAIRDNFSYANHEVDGVGQGVAQLACIQCLVTRYFVIGVELARLVPWLIYHIVVYVRVIR